jgi:hypothetical protein
MYCVQQLLDSDGFGHDHFSCLSMRLRLLHFSVVPGSADKMGTILEAAPVKITKMMSFSADFSLAAKTGMERPGFQMKKIVSFR